MLYLDSSALVKHYLHEPGTQAVEAPFQSGEKIFTSALSHTEVHAALAKKYHDKAIQGVGLVVFNPEDSG